MTDLQKRILDIFREVRDILDRNGITYFAIGGTCIGAVRHGGFIPWDDDLDIAVPIEQFGRMLDLLKAELPPSPFSNLRRTFIEKYLFIRE